MSKKKQEDGPFPKWVKFIVILLGSLSPKLDTRIKAAKAWNKHFGDWGKITEEDIKQEVNQFSSKQHLKSSDI